MGGGGVTNYGGDLSTRQSAFPERPDLPMVEFNGRSYLSYGDSSPRIKLPLAVIIPRTFDLAGWLSISGTNGAAAGGPETDVPGLQAAKTLWDEAYIQSVFLGEARDGYRHLPSSLKVSDHFKEYISQYMLVLAKLTTLIAIQKLASYDVVLRKIALAGMVGATRSRLDNVLRTLTAIPMYSVFHNLALYLATPILGGSTTPVVLKTFPYQPVTFGKFGLTPVLNNQVVGAKNSAADEMTVYGDLHSSIWWQKEYADILELMKPLLRTGLTGDNLEDVLAIQGLFRMLNVQPNPMSYRDVTPAMVDPMLAEEVLHYGLYSGKQLVTGGTDKRVMGPDVAWNNGLIEIRTPGPPTLGTILGFNGPIAGSANQSDVDAAAGGYLLGVSGEVQELGTSAPTETTWKNMYLGMVRRVYSEDNTFKDVHSLIHKTVSHEDFRDQYPLPLHWWSDVATAAEASPTIRRGEPDDVAFFFPYQDYGWHYLKWLSEALQIPYLVG